MNRAVAELRLLHAIVLDLDHAPTLERALQVVLRRVGEATGWTLGETWLPDGAGRELARGPVWHRADARLTQFLRKTASFRFKRGEGLPGRVWRSRRPAWIRDVRVDSNFPRARLARGSGLKAGFAIPVLAGREVVAVLNFFVFARREEDAHLVDLVTTVAAQLGPILRRRLLEDALRSSRRTVEAQEAERRRLARDLHDGVNQGLAAAVFSLRAVEEGEADPGDVARARGLVEEALRDLRRLCRNLGPAALDDLGLPAAVRGLCRDVGERTGVRVDFEERRFPRRLDPRVRLGLFRVVQEALSNAERHAAASRIRVSLARAPASLEVAVRDNGRGFEPGSRHAGLGLGFLRERAGLLRGSLALRSNPGRGTEVRLRVPWPLREASP